jgi:hypothetical protein
VRFHRPDLFQLSGKSHGSRYLSANYGNFQNNYLIASRLENSDPKILGVF